LDIISFIVTVERTHFTDTITRSNPEGRIIREIQKQIFLQEAREAPFKILFNTAVVKRDISIEIIQYNKNQMRTYIKKIDSFPSLTLKILKSRHQRVLVAVEELYDTPVGWGCTYVCGKVCAC
jgi:hypothetical protein